MMQPIRTILCPVDFSPLCEREIELGAQLAERFDADLLLQHNLAIGSALGVSWLHEKEHHAEDETRESEIREKLTAALQRTPARVRNRARAAITYGALDHCVQTMAEQAGVDLIVIGTHGRSRPEHASETEKLITGAPCPVLTTRDDAPHEWLPVLGTEKTGTAIATLVPVDFSSHAVRALRYALDVADYLPLEITALYVAERDGRDADWATAQLAKAVPVERQNEITLEIKHGTVPEQILLEEEFHEARLVIMGAHAKGLLERLFGHHTSTAREMLHRSSCPVWFVPASAEA